MKLHTIAFVLVIIGALNWGLVALGYWVNNNLNIVNLLLGTMPTIENLVYLLVGVSAVILMLGHKKDCRTCNPSGAM
jgi:uncharacterized membrane protein YuzA (DUF378 family)